MAIPFVICFIFVLISFPNASCIIKNSSGRDIVREDISEDHDSCLQDFPSVLQTVHIPVSATFCLNLTIDGIMKDKRIHGSEVHYQCRSVCSDLLVGMPAGFLRANILKQNCSFCESLGSLHPYISWWLSPSRVPKRIGYQVCVPRHVCIQECGPEKPGCIHSGSCASQICFTGADSNKTAQIKRYTHAGPGTIVVVDNTLGSQNGSLSSTISDNPDELVRVISDGKDYCRQSGLQYSVASTSGGSNEPLSSQSKSEVSQCRALNAYYNFSQVEVVRMNTDCGYCGLTEAQQYVSIIDSTYPHICIPRALCIEQCGAEGYGCIYTGSCQSRICFSGINSKMPAYFTTLNQNGSASNLSVDNSGGPVDADPPAFGPLGSQCNGTSLPPSTRIYSSRLRLRVTKHLTAYQAFLAVNDSETRCILAGPGELLEIDGTRSEALVVVTGSVVVAVVTVATFLLVLVLSCLRRSKRQSEATK